MGCGFDRRNIRECGLGRLDGGMCGRDRDPGEGGWCLEWGLGKRAAWGGIGRRLKGTLRGFGRELSCTLLGAVA